MSNAMLGIALARQRAGMKELGGQLSDQSSPTQGPNIEFRIPGYANGAPGKPLPPNSRPAVPAKPFLSKIADMIAGILGGGLKAFGNGLKTVTGAGGVTAMSGVLGMMGYAGPYGYDPFGPGQSMDPYAQSMPETNSCYQLLETWLRQCSAQPESFLEISAVTSAPEASKDENRITIKVSKSGSEVIHPPSLRTPHLMSS